MLRYNLQSNSRSLLFLIALALALSATPTARAAENENEKRFQPYFLSLRFNETYMRSGPGRKYPALWIYRRVGMPIEVLGHFDDWRKVRDFQGDSGWMLSNQLQRRRSVIVALEEVGLYEKPNTDSRKYARLGKEVVARVKKCTPEWCLLSVDEHKGWARRGGLWGLRSEEILP